MPQPQPAQSKSSNRPPSGVMQHFCLRCGSSRCRDAVAHAAAHVAKK